MKLDEAVHVLGIAKWAMADMGLSSCADEAEQAQLRIPRMDRATRQEYARSIVPPGRRGRVLLVLLSPEQARARAFIAAVIRSAED
jgi:hypothetical protein